MPPRREPEHGPGDRGGRPRAKKKRDDDTGLDERVSVSGGGTRVSSTGHVTTGSMTAPAGADFDGPADASDEFAQAWFSSGTGPAMHYHYEDAAGVGQEAQEASG